MFQVHVNDGNKEMPQDDIYYIVAKEGIFLKKKMGIMESLAPVDNISILESVATSAKMHIPKLPAQSFAKVIQFFYQVYEEYRGESIVLLFYNEETQKFKIIPPQQKVSYGGLDYNRSITIEGYTMIGDIHSHARMSAFHSTIDDDDEKTFDGLHITIGNLDESEVSITSSIVANGFRFTVEPTEYIAGIKLTKDVDEEKEETNYKTKVYKIVGGKLVLDEQASKPTLYRYRKFDKRYVSLVPPSKRKVSDSWMNKVEKGTYVYTYGYGVGRSGGEVFTGRSYRDGKWQDFNRRHWGDHYDSHAWQQYHKVGTKPPTHAVIPETTKELPNLQLPLFDQEDDIIPCFTCKYREEKLLLEEDDSLDDELYKCEKCNLVISSESDELTCPNCKTDNHLILIDDENLTDNFKEIPDQQITECPHCSMILSPDENHYICPYCFRSIAEYDKEKELQLQQFIDSGLLLDPESEEANNEALKQIETSGVDKIPEPDKDVIPISTKHQQEPTWKTMLKKAFKGTNA